MADFITHEERVFEEVGSVFSGLCRNGVPYSGELTVRAPDGVMVTGTFTATDQSKPNVGEWVGEQPRNDHYAGEWENGAFHGHGELTLATGVIYTGEFVGGQYHGRGALKDVNGDVYIGEFEWGRRHGKGSFTILLDEDTPHSLILNILRFNPFYAERPDLRSYDGEWKEDQRHGQGTAMFTDGSKYTGGWKMGKRHGEGTFLESDGSRTIDAQWKEDALECDCLHRFILPSSNEEIEVVVRSGKWERSLNRTTKMWSKFTGRCQRVNVVGPRAADKTYIKPIYGVYELYGSGVATLDDAIATDAGCGLAQHTCSGVEELLSRVTAVFGNKIHSSAALCGNMLMFTNGKTFKGSLEGGLMTGFCTVKWIVGNTEVTYTGEMEGNLAHGIGRLMTENASEIHSYDGQWRYNMRWGHGVLTRYDKHSTEATVVFDGHWACDMMHGPGRHKIDTPPVVQEDVEEEEPAFVIDDDDDEEDEKGEEVQGIRTPTAAQVATEKDMDYRVGVWTHGVRTSVLTEAVSIKKAVCGFCLLHPEKPASHDCSGCSIPKCDTCSSMSCQFCKSKGDCSIC